MKLFLITREFPPSMGGVQRYSYNTISNLHLFKAIVMCFSDTSNKAQIIDKELSDKGHKVIRSNLFPEQMGPLSIVKGGFSVLVFCARILAIIKREKVDVLIFGHVTFFYLYVLIFLKMFYRKPIFLLFHGEEIPVIKLKSNGLMRILIKRAGVIICNSNFTSSRLEEFLIEEKKRVIAYPGVEERFFIRTDISEAKLKYNVEGKRVLYTVGRLDKRKGHDLVIRSLPEILKRFPNVIYLIAGTGPNIEDLRKDVEKYGVSDVVRFLGFVQESDIMSLHQAGDIFVMPNRILEDGDTEGFGIVFLEASASGKPVIGGRAGGAVEAIENGVSGYVVNPYDDCELIEKIIYLLDNGDVAKLMGANGKERAWERFRWPVLVERFEQEIKTTRNQ
jgi:phosphatidyl-myo-inositol dimannoside synthase